MTVVGVVGGFLVVRVRHHVVVTHDIVVVLLTNGRRWSGVVDSEGSR